MIKISFPFCEEMSKFFTFQTGMIQKIGPKICLFKLIEGNFYMNLRRLKLDFGGKFEYHGDILYF